MLPEFGAVELLFIAAIALIVVGPKDLPILMRKAGKFLAQMRGMAAEFRASFDEMARQSELEELRKEVEAMRNAAHQPVQALVADTGIDEVKDEIDARLSDRLNPPSEASAAETSPSKASPHVGPEGEPLPKQAEDAEPAPEARP
jgi:sec-independent protein translocase protein TatB